MRSAGILNAGARGLAVFVRDQAHVPGGEVRTVRIQLAEVLATLGCAACQVPSMARGKARFAIALEGHAL